MEACTVYPPALLDLLTAEGFERQFWCLYSSADWKSQEACYEVLESKREHYFGSRYYSEYASFKASKNARYRRKKKTMFPKTAG